MTLYLILFQLEQNQQPKLQFVVLLLFVSAIWFHYSQVQQYLVYGDVSRIKGYYSKFNNKIRKGKLF